MEHTQGKLHGGKTEHNKFDLFDENGLPIFRFSTCGKKEHNSKRVKALWNVADGKSTAQVIRHVEHGARMIKAIRKSCNDCRAEHDSFEHLPPCHTNPKAWVCPTQTLLEQIGG